jgi:hypothetical protein
MLSNFPMQGSEEALILVPIGLTNTTLLFLPVVFDKFLNTDMNGYLSNFHNILFYLKP